LFKRNLGSAPLVDVAETPGNSRNQFIGGGFGGVMAAESLAQRLDPERQITLKAA
jgi:hypothetical protein